jgi:hypothetical protein
MGNFFAIGPDWPHPIGQQPMEIVPEAEARLFFLNTQP